MRPDPPAPKGDASDWFGYLPAPITVDFGAGRIEPVENYPEVRDWVVKFRWLSDMGNKEGTLHPPIAKRCLLDLKTHEPVGIYKNSEEPALIHRVPASHRLHLPGLTIDQRARRLGLGGFIVHLAGYLYDTRQQFHDWWFDTSVPIAEESLDPDEQVASDFVTGSYDRVRSWPEERQLFTTNILFMHCRASSHRWHWERLSAEYMVTDALYKLALQLGGVAPVKQHADRIIAMCEWYGVNSDANHRQTIGRIVERRNELMHEALWESVQPSGGGSSRGYHDVFSLHRLNQRLVCAILNYPNGFVRSAWDTLSPCYFDRAK
jgi:hypothetical protein